MLIPGIPTLIRKLGIECKSFVLPCLGKKQSSWFYSEGDFTLDPDLNDYFSRNTEPLYKVGMSSYVGVDPYTAVGFFRFHDSIKSSESRFIPPCFIAMKAKIQHYRKFSKKIRKFLKKVQPGEYLLEFKFWRVKSRKLSEFNEIFEFINSENYALIDKTEELDYCLDPETTVIYHHTLHTYEEYREENKGGILEVLKMSKKAARYNIINLHFIQDSGREDPLMRIKTSHLKSALKKAKFDEILYVEVEKGKLDSYEKEIYDLSIRPIGLEEITSLKTGNFRWLVLKTD
jgi:hypothetical protein